MSSDMPAESNYTKFLVDKESDGVRLDRYIRHKFGNTLTQGVIEKSLRNGHIKVNGKKAKSSYRIMDGQSVSVRELVEKKKKKKQLEIIYYEEFQDLKNSIIYEDEHIIAFNKESGMVVQGGSGIRISIDDMLHALVQADEERPKLVHRLDKETTGVLIVARSTYSARYLAALFRNRDIDKVYSAIVKGKLPNKEGVINLPLGPIFQSGEARIEIDHTNGKESLTKYKVLQECGDSLSLLELKAVTGRKHQLRVHLAAIGCPILGDNKYFDGDKRSKLYLHSCKISLNLPSGKPICIEAPLPDYFQDVISKKNT